MRILIPAIIGAALIVASPTAAQAAQAQSSNVVMAAPQQTGSSSSTQTGSSSSTGKTQNPPKPAKPKKPPVPRKPLGLRAYFIFDTELMAASESFKAVTDSSMVFGYGAGADVLNLWRNIFARVAWTTQSKTGERAFVVDDAIVKTGFPVDLKLNTLEVSGGWREYMKKHPNIALYAGGGVIFVSYSETSPFAVTESENFKDKFTGYTALGGLEFSLTKLVTAGVEGQYRIVPDAIGKDGVSKVLGESDLGGFVIRGMIGIRFRK